jgi:hypothetical protein
MTDLSILYALMWMLLTGFSAMVYCAFIHPMVRKTGVFIRESIRILEYRPTHSRSRC